MSERDWGATHVEPVVYESPMGWFAHGIGWAVMAPTSEEVDKEVPGA